MTWRGSTHLGHPPLHCYFIRFLVFLVIYTSRLAKPLKIVPRIRLSIQSVSTFIVHVLCIVQVVQASPLHLTEWHLQDRLYWQSYWCLLSFAFVYNVLLDLTAITAVGAHAHRTPVLLCEYVAD